MSIKEYDSIFDQLDNSCHGYLTAGQLQNFHKSVYFNSLPVPQINTIINQICGQTSSGRVTRELFLIVLAEIERRRTIQEQAYWDFRALDCNGDSKIHLKDALILFQEFHGESFSLEMWNAFLSSREYPYCDVYYDEIKSWLCEAPEGQPCSQEEFIAEEKRLEVLTNDYKWEELNSWKKLQGDEDDIEDYKEEMSRETKRRLQKWNLQGVESMINDDGLDLNMDSDNVRLKPKNYVNISDVLELIEQKYNILQDRLLLNMAEYSSNMEDEISDIFQNLRKTARKLLKDKTLGMKAHDLTGSSSLLPYTCLALMGHHKTDPDFNAASEKIYNLKKEGKPEKEIRKLCWTEFDDLNKGSKLCGDVLVQLHERQKQEKDFCISLLHQVQGQKSNVSNLLSTELASLSHQHSLLGYESGINQSLLSVGLGERDHGEKAYGVDEIRSKTLVSMKLAERKGRRHTRVSDGKITLEKLDDLGQIDLKLKLISEMDRKHFFEREAMIFMLQGPDAKPTVEQLRRLTDKERQQQQTHSRNQHQNWMKNLSSNNQDAESRDAHLKILQTGVSLYWLNQQTNMESIETNVNDEDVSSYVFSKLKLHQENEIRQAIRDIQNMAPKEWKKMIKKEHSLCINECFNGIAFVTMGSLQLSDTEKEYVDSLDQKYTVIRDKIFIYILQQKHGLDWINLAEEIKEKELNKLRKTERKLRAEGKDEELTVFLGSKIMEMSSLSFYLGPHKWKSSPYTGSKKNILTDITERYESEQQALLAWLKSDGVKDMPGRKKRKEIVFMALETRVSRLEQDLQSAYLKTGLLERLEDKDNEDTNRLTRLSEVSVKSWRERIEHNVTYTKTFQTQTTPKDGDITGWQLHYLTEVKYRHSDEREELLNIVKDVSSEFLQEAAAMMGEGDRQKRLSELQTKYLKLDLTSKDDHEEYRTVLEEAGAIQVLCRKALLQKGRRRGITPDMIAVSLLNDLFKQQQKETLALYNHLDKMDEEEIKSQLDKELDCRKNDISPNVIKVLTVVQGAAHDHDILQALDRKYDVLKDKLLLEALRQSLGNQNWNKMTEKDKQKKFDQLKENTEIPWRQGNLEELCQFLGINFQLDFSLKNKFGIDRESFMKKGIMADHLQDTGSVSLTGNDVIQFLWSRQEEEKDYILSLAQGTSGVFMSDTEKFVLISRLKREKDLCNDRSSLYHAGLLVGLMERQTEEVKNIPIVDIKRYEVLGAETLEWCRSHNDDVIIQKPSPSTDMMTLQYEVLILLRNQNRQEVLELFRLLTSDKQEGFRNEASVKSRLQRNDRLASLKNNLKSFDQGNTTDYLLMLSEALVYTTENILALKENENSSLEELLPLMMSLLLQHQLVQAEQIMKNFSKQSIEELVGICQQIVADHECKKCKNIVDLIFSQDIARESTQDEILTALEGKYDALHDKLIVEALINQYGEMNWSKITDEERQKKVTEMKLKERKLRREGKYDEVNKLIGDSLKNQEALSKLLGESQAEQERKLAERLKKRKQRLKEGKSEEECDQLEAQDIENDKTDILTKLNNKLQEEKEELLNQLSNNGDGDNHEQQKQSQLIKLMQEERKVRNEEGFDTAALVIGLADTNKSEESENEDKERQWMLAKERLLAARRRRLHSAKKQEEIIPEDIESVTNKTRLREILLMVNDKNHSRNRNYLIRLLEDTDDNIMKELHTQSNEYLETKISESCELRKKWKESNDSKVEDELDIFKEVCGCTIEVKGREKGTGYDLDELKVELLADLQHLQDIETRQLRLQIPLKEMDWLKNKINEIKEGYNHDNIGVILFLGQGQAPVEESNKDETAVIAALEKKYDVMRDKLIVEALMKEMGQADWNRLTQLERQKKVVHIKLQSRKMKKEGKMDAEVSKLIGKHLQDTKVVNTLLGASKIDQKRRFEEKLAQRRLKKIERENTMGITRENSSLEDVKKFEEKKTLKKNILENLEKQLEQDKERLLTSLRSKTNKIDRAKARWKMLAKLQREQKLLQAEENVNSAALVFNIGAPSALRKEKSFIQERERHRELAKGRLQNKSTPRTCLEENQEDIFRFLMDDKKPQIQKNVKDRMMENIDQHHQYEREVFMKLLKLAEQNMELINQAQSQTEEELKIRLTHLQKDQSRIQTDAQQSALTVNLELMDQSEKETYFVGVAKRRSLQFKHFAEAVVYRIEVELRIMKEQRQDASEEDLYKELTVSLLADLQERQETESSTLQNMMLERDDQTLENICGVQKVAQREGWYKNLSVVLFTLTSSADDLDLLPDITMETKKLEEEFEREKKDITDKALEENVDPNPQIDELIEEFRSRKQELMKRYEKRCLEIREKLAAKKHAQEKKEIKEVEATQLVEMAEMRAKAMKDGKTIKRKTSLLQERLSVAREEKLKAEEKEKQISSRSKSVDAKRVALLAREKTVFDTEMSTDQKSAMLSQIVRQQQNLESKRTDQQKQQEEMLQRKLDARRRDSTKDGRLMGARQKTGLDAQRSKSAERS